MVQPNFILSNNLGILRDMIANTVTWQEWTNHKDDPDEAKEHVYYATPTQAQIAAIEYPYAVIDLADDWSIDLVSEGRYANFTGMGSLFIQIEDEIADMFLENPSDAFLNFTNNLGGLVDDLAASSGRDDNLFVRKITIEVAPIRNDDEEENVGTRLFRTLMRVDVGLATEVY